MFRQYLPFSISRRNIGIQTPKKQIHGRFCRNRFLAHWPKAGRTLDCYRQKNKIDISHQKGRQFAIRDFETFDYIYVMDNSNYNDIIHLAKTPEQRNKVQLILNELFPDENLDVPDPYYGLANGFDNVYEMLDQACDIIAHKLIEKHS